MSSSAATANYAGIQNALFYGDNCEMVYGDAQAVVVKMLEAVRGLSLSAGPNQGRRRLLPSCPRDRQGLRTVATQV